MDTSLLGRTMQIYFKDQRILVFFSTKHFHQTFTQKSRFQTCTPGFLVKTYVQRGLFNIWLDFLLNIDIFIGFLLPNLATIPLNSGRCQDSDICHCSQNAEWTLGKFGFFWLKILRPKNSEILLNLGEMQLKKMAKFYDFGSQLCRNNLGSWCLFGAIKIQGLVVY